MTNKPNDMRVSRELLEAIYTAGWERSSEGYNAEWSCNATDNDDWKSDMSQAIDAALLAQPADQQGEPVACTSCDGSGEYIDALGDWRGYCCCPPGIELNARHAQPATAKVVLPDDWQSLADLMQKVGAAYWKAAVVERGPGAVQWLHNQETGAFFVFTRGEYAEQMKDFVISLDDVARLNNIGDKP